MNFKCVMVGPKTLRVHIVRSMEHVDTFDALFKGVNHTIFTKHQIRIKKNMLIKITFRYYVHSADIIFLFLL